MPPHTVLAGEGWLWAVWEAATDALAISDADGTVLAVNPAYQTLYGFSPDEVVGHSFAIIFPEAERASAEAQYREIFALPGQPPRFESVVRRRDGSERIVDSRASFLEQDGKRVAMLSIIRDITDEVAARRNAERVEESRRNLLSSLSHDIKSPLAVIKGHAQTLRRRVRRGAFGTTSDQLTAGLSQIEDSALQVASLVDELVEVSGLDNTELPPLRLDAVDLVALVRDAVDRHQRLANESVLRLEVDTDAIVGNWDAARLRRVLDNLLGNAVKYSPSGGAITIRACLADGLAEPAHGQPSVTSSSAPRAPGAILVVEDQGIGIAPVDLPHVFERFHRGSNVGNAMSGAGIGLSSVQQVVEQHGGLVRIESREGAGTTVTVWLPFEAGPQTGGRQA